MLNINNTFRNVFKAIPVIAFCKYIVNANHRNKYNKPKTSKCQAKCG